ncbi:MAG: hypothetical protein RH942_13215 [Kiloniellaceae bacterium]
MVGGGIDYEGELAAARLRMKLEQNVSLAEGQRLRREEAAEQLFGRLLALVMAAVFFVLVYLFG